MCNTTILYLLFLEFIQLKYLHRNSKFSLEEWCATSELNARDCVAYKYFLVWFVHALNNLTLLWIFLYLFYSVLSHSPFPMKISLFPIKISLSPMKISLSLMKISLFSVYEIVKYFKVRIWIWKHEWKIEEKNGQINCRGCIPKIAHAEIIASSSYKFTIKNVGNNIQIKQLHFVILLYIFTLLACFCFFSFLPMILQS